MFFNSIPVLMYHHVMPVKSSLNVMPEIFEEQLRGLKTRGWKILDSQEFIYLLSNPREKRKKCLLITFDDGFLDNYLYAYPILKKYCMKAVLFVATDFIIHMDLKRQKFTPLPHKEMWKLAFSERKYEVMCTWEELKEMEESGTFDIQSHGHSHKIPDFIKKSDYKSLEGDLNLGMQLLIQHLNKKPLHLAWPKGVYDYKAINIAKKLGFQVLYTTQRGANTKDPFHIKRIAIKNKGIQWLNTRMIIYNSWVLTKCYNFIRSTF